MRVISVLICLAIHSTALHAQTAVVERITSQDIADVFGRIARNAGQVNPMLEQLRVAEWISKGASDTYLTQWESTRTQFTSIQADMAAAAQHPDQMTDGIKALFRVQAAHRMLTSLMGGLRKYQNPALADLIESVAAEDRANEDRLQQYLLELASDKEQQLETMNVEAQRCRGILSRQPAEPALRATPPAIQPATRTQ